MLRALPPRIKLALPLHPNTNSAPITATQPDCTTPLHKGNSQDLVFQDFCMQERADTLQWQLQSSLLLVRVQECARYHSDSTSDLNSKTYFVTPLWIQQLHLKQTNQPTFRDCLQQPKASNQQTVQLITFIRQVSTNPSSQAWSHLCCSKAATIHCGPNGSHGWLDGIHPSRLLFPKEKERLFKQKVTQQNPFPGPTAIKDLECFKTDADCGSSRRLEQRHWTEHAPHEHGLKGPSRFHCYPCA